MQRKVYVNQLITAVSFDHDEKETLIYRVKRGPAI